MTKQEIDAMIDNGITAKIHELLGVWSCDFYPFMPQHLATNDDGEVSTDITYDSNFSICNEEPDSDCEDFNDNARWTAKTILKIIQLEETDPNAHADWSADYDYDKKTGKYIFNVEFIKKENL